MGGLMEIRRRMMASTELPPGYERKEYLLRPSQNARINTDVPGNDTTIRIYADMMMLGFAQYGGLLGNTAGETSCCWRLLTSTSSYKNVLIFTCMNRRAGSSSSVRATNVTELQGHRIQTLMEYGKASLTVEGSTFSTTITADGTTAISSNRLAIGGSNVTATGSAMDTRFYAVKIWAGGKLVRDYVPCVRKADDKVGFYDLVNHTFNPSIGTAEFTVE